MSEIKNALIKSVSIDTERCLSAWLHLDYGGSGQGFGGFVLFNEPYDLEKRQQGKHLLGAYAGLFIQRCIEIGGVTRWEDLPGKTIRVKSDFTKVQAIGHILNDKWFDPSAEFEVVQRIVERLTK